jgi:N-acetylglutamate synthase-like GNAT family acetyltransferase
MIAPSNQNDFSQILEIINDAAAAYRGIIPADRWHEPYMPADELKKQMEDGVQFWKYIAGDRILGVMGIQDKRDVTLIRHAYVRTSERNKGIGGKLLTHLCSGTIQPILVGTWIDATWAIDFYRKHGFRSLPEKQKNELLRKYWTIPERQVETSVVLANFKFPNE